ncbi:MAG: hypothetical protein ACHREM_19435, partial [Polyangiales bacterium]
MTSQNRRAWTLTCAVLVGCGGRTSTPGTSVDASIASTTTLVAAPNTASAKLIQRDGAWHATSHRSHFETTIDARGATLTGLGTSTWTLGLHATRVGRDGAMRPLSTSLPNERDGRVAFDRGDNVSEWFVHDTRGLEHGFDVRSRPIGNGSLVIDVEVDGLTPTVISNGAGVSLAGASGHGVLRYEQLVANDAAGRRLPARMVVDGRKIALRVEDAGARYPIVVDPLVNMAQQAVLVASDGASGDAFGTCVGISGSTVIVGAPDKLVGSNANQGAAYVFSGSGSTWTQVGPDLHASDGAANDNFAANVAIDGSTAILGTPNKTVGANVGQGAAYVFAASGSTWKQVGPALHASDGTASDSFGSSVAISGTTAIIGASGKSAHQGVAYIFSGTGATWTQLGPALQASDASAGDYFGYSVAINGTTAIVGAPHKYDAVPDSGIAYVFTQAGATWTQQTELLGTSAGSDTLFGFSVALSGTTLIIGMSPSRSLGYIYTGAGPSWSAPVYAPGNSPFALDGSMMIATYAGNLVLPFMEGSGGWTRVGANQLASGNAGDGFGSSIAISGITAVVGAPTAAIGAGQGAAYIFAAVHANGDACTSSH